MSILGRRIGKVLETLALYLVSEAQVEVGASLISNNLSKIIYSLYGPPGSGLLRYLVGPYFFFDKNDILHEFWSAHRSQHLWGCKPSESLLHRFEQSEPHFFPAYKRNL